jgi:hypothetical protein
MKNIDEEKLIFQERTEMVSLLTTIRKQSKNPAIRLMIKTYFNSKYGLYAKLKQQVPYYYQVVSPELWLQLSQIPEDIINLEDAIEFLINFYYKHQRLTTAQQAQRLMDVEALKKLEEDCENAKRK